MKLDRSIATLLAVVALLPNASTLAGVGTAFTYQGRLTDTTPVPPPNYDFRFDLFEEETLGVALATFDVEDVALQGGLFTVTIDFGVNAFDGNPRFIAIGVRPGDSLPGTDFDDLLPRVRITPTPYALFAVTAATAETAVTATSALTATTATSALSATIAANADSAAVADTVVVPVDLSGGAIAAPDFVISGQNTSMGAGVRGTSTDGIGVVGSGLTGVSGDGPIGVLGTSSSEDGHGVAGSCTSSTTGFGVFAESSGSGLLGAALRARGHEEAGANSVGLHVTSRSSFVATPGQTTPATIVLENKGTGDLIRAMAGTNARFRIDTVGNTSADGTYASPAQDFAELLPAASASEPGDVLAIGLDGRLVLSSQPSQSSVAGVHSTKPGFLGGQQVDVQANDKIPLAVVGVVPVKATAENGPIVPGDMLVASSSPGRAMKAPQNPAVGTVLGKALSSLQSGSGVIQVLVSPR